LWVLYLVNGLLEIAESEVDILEALGWGLSRFVEDGSI